LALQMKVFLVEYSEASTFKVLPQSVQHGIFSIKCLVWTE
jgi:hypothetical protein